MKVVSKWPLSGLLLAVLLVFTASVAFGQPVSLTVFDPTGTIEVKEAFAPRIADLSGIKICEVSNDGWEVTRMLPLVRSLLEDKFPGISFVTYDNFPQGIFDIDINSIGDMVQAQGCQAAILGNAG